MSRWLKRDGDLVLDMRDNADLVRPNLGVTIPVDEPRPKPAEEIASPGRLTFGWESCAVLFKEPNVNDLLRAHWDELGLDHEKMPLDPDFNRYIALEALGIFRVWAARDGPTLVGYLAFQVIYNLHYKSTLHAMEDLFLLSAPYRKGLAGYRMFKGALDALKELGVKRVILHEKTHFQQERGGLGKLFGRLGFSHTDNLWICML
jgi:hypothetical protein